MDELIDIVNLKGELTGKNCLKSFAHQNGILHASVHVWLYNDNGEILIQKRSADKEIFPNLWDVSVAGHIASLEQPLITAIRETNEEIGYNIAKENIDYYGIWEEKHIHSNGLVDHEIHHIYISKLKKCITKLNIQTEEVSLLNLISLTKLKEQYKKANIFVPHQEEYYKYIIKILSERINNEK